VLTLGTEVAGGIDFLGITIWAQKSRFHHHTLANRKSIDAGTYLIDFPNHFVTEIETSVTRERSGSDRGAHVNVE
jgi:hypothetical protein